MKIKVTLIVARCKNLNTQIPKVEILLNEGRLPSKYIACPDEKRTIRDLWEEHLNLDFNFCKKELQDFRVIDINEAEVVYICYSPYVGGMLKFGEFKEEATLESKGIFLDEFYKSAIARRSRSTFK
jgi:hypothetical protein